MIALWSYFSQQCKILPIRVIICGSVRAFLNAMYVHSMYTALERTMREACALLIVNPLQDSRVPQVQAVASLSAEVR